ATFPHHYSVRSSPRLPSRSRSATSQKVRCAHLRWRILEPPPDRGCVRRTSRSKCGCPKSPNDPKTRGLAVPLRLVLRTQPRSVSARFWWWFQDAPAGDRADVSIVPVRPALQTCWHNSSDLVFSANL